MKRTFLFVCIALAAIVSCEKNQDPINENLVVKGVPVALTASFGQPASKVTYTVAGSALKATWDASEAISVVTYNSSGEVLAVDKFTYSGDAGSSSAVFSGVYTGGDDPYRVRAIYPAIEFEGDYGYLPSYTDYGGVSRNILFSFHTGDRFFNNGEVYCLKQSSDDNCGHFENYCVASGDVNISDIKAGKLTTTLSHLSLVIKFKLTFADAYKGKTLDAVNLSMFKSNDEQYTRVFAEGGWQYATAIEYGMGGKMGADSWTIYTAFNVPASGTATLYMPVYVPWETDYAIGDYWKITATVGGSELTPVAKTFTKAVSLATGKMYTVQASIE